MLIIVSYEDYDNSLLKQLLIMFMLEYMVIAFLYICKCLYILFIIIGC
jgi:hypothetical protein